MHDPFPVWQSPLRVSSVDAGSLMLCKAELFDGAKACFVHYHASLNPAWI